MTPQERLDRLLKAIGQADSMLILPHNDPDPDAIASAVALRYLLLEKLGVTSQIIYKGIIGRAENKALVRYLGYPLRRLVDSDWSQAGAVAMVDTQPGAGNNSLPSRLTPAIVLDHHPSRQSVPSDGSKTGTGFTDIRPDIGATATMITEYLHAADLAPSVPLATALFYGIKTDTMRVGRNLSQADVTAYLYLQPRIDVEALVEIERAQVPADYFKSFDAALRGARIYDGVVISYIGQMSYPDLAAEMADLLLRLKGTQWVICMGLYKSNMNLAVRTRRRRGAGQLVQTLVGSRGTAGGHGSMAGGYLVLDSEEPESVVSQISQQVVLHFNLAPGLAGKSLL